MKRPNFIFILIDDMGWKDVGCCGSEFYETPNLDRLADEGIRFSNAYASCPVCSPTRASILTGKYPARVGVTDYIGGESRGKVISPPYLHHLPLEEKTIAETLRDAGYRTYHVGKWHLGGEPYHPEKQGFDINIGGCEKGSLRSHFSPYNLPTLEDGPEGEYMTDRLTDEAIKLIKDNGDSPFFLYLPHYTVHTPIQAPQSYVEKYQDKARNMGLDKVNALEENGFFPCEHRKKHRIVRRLIQSNPIYAGMVDNLDWNIGRLLKAVDEEGLTQDTVVIFTSDNGGLSTSEGSPTCNLPLSEGKGWMYEGGTREPLIIKYPNVIKAGSVSDAVTTSPDFYPTILEMAGLDLMPEQHCDGVSIFDVLKGKNELDRDAIFWHYPHYGNQGGTPGASVRCGDYKLIEFFEDGRLELYNLVEDVSEEHNIADDEPEITRELHSRLYEWRASVNAKMPEPNPDYVP